MKYFHIATVLIALLYPMLPALVYIDEGYIMANSPTTMCTGWNVDVTFFTIVLPTSILMAVAISALIIMFWKILKVYIHEHDLSRIRLQMHCAADFI